MEIRPFAPSDEQVVVKLWQDCGLVVPWNNPSQDIRRKLKVQADGFLVALMDGQIIATVMAGYEGHRGWINYLAVDPRLRYRGIGRSMMKAAEAYLRAAGCPKINLQVRRSNAGVIDFYEKIGFGIDDAVSLGKRLQPDDKSDFC